MDPGYGVLWQDISIFSNLNLLSCSNGSGFSGYPNNQKGIQNSVSCVQFLLLAIGLTSLIEPISSTCKRCLWPLSCSDQHQGNPQESLRDRQIFCTWNYYPEANSIVHHQLKSQDPNDLDLSIRFSLEWIQDLQIHHVASILRFRMFASLIFIVLLIN